MSASIPNSVREVTSYVRPATTRVSADFDIRHLRESRLKLTVRGVCKTHVIDVCDSLTENDEGVTREVGTLEKNVTYKQKTIIAERDAALKRS